MITIQIKLKQYFFMIKFKSKNISQILKRRGQLRRTKVVNNSISKRSIYEDCTNQIKLEIFIKKPELSFDDKLQLIGYIEKKYRLYFTPAYNYSQSKWIRIKDQTEIDHSFDSNKKSYYLLSGFLKIIPKQRPAQPVQQDKNPQLNSQMESKHTKILSGQTGVGILFSPFNYKCRIYAENALLLQIKHDKLQQIQTNCLMTNREREFVLKKLNIFRNIQNFNKLYLPYFQLKQFNKGQRIYSLDEKSQYFYIIVDGVVQFQSLISVKNLVESTSSKIGLSSLIRGCNEPKHIFVITGTMPKFNYFGEEEILGRSLRTQNVKCKSLTCLVFQLSLLKFAQLLTQTNIKKVLEVSAETKQEKRNLFIQSSIKIQQKSQNNQSMHSSSTEFNSLKTTIHHNLSGTIEKPTKISLNLKRFKIIHNNEVKLSQKAQTNTIQTYSMLDVNKQMFDKTLKRFRYSLQQIRRAKQFKLKISNRGRTLQEIWDILKLQKSTHKHTDAIGNFDKEGLRSYQHHKRLVKHLKEIKSYKPRSISCSYKARTEYIQYLHSLI